MSSQQLEERAKQMADARAAQKMTEAKKAQEDPGAPFTFLSGKKLPSDFKNPPCGTRFHRCVDKDGIYRPNWKQFRVYRTDNTQAERIYVQSAAVRGSSVIPCCNNWVMTGVWMDAPVGVIETIRQSRTEVVDMASTDSEGKPLGLTGPQRIFRTIEDRPKYNCEVMASA